MPKTTKDTPKKEVKKTTKKQTTASSKKVTKDTKSTKKVASKKSNVATKKSATSKSVSKNTTSKKQVLKNIPVINNEYYDLPYRYNDTLVKILAQTPKCLFIYWDISDNDRQKYIQQYGQDFFNNTYPVLIVHNVTKNYDFEVTIDDFTNSWYLKINDEKCKYNIELGRRPRINDYIPNGYLYVTSSNEIEAPNNHILFDESANTIYFKNVKTNEIFEKNLANLVYITNLGKVKRLYSLMYKEEKLDDLLGNPSSATSTFM